MTDFASLGLAEPILKSLAAEGYQTPTPIQQQSIPLLLEGRDLLGLAQTGTGKTAAFALPILHRLMANRRRAPGRGMRALILAPTRELAVQIHDSLRAYGRNLPLTSACVMGGVGMAPQVKALARGVDILIATTGRLMDLMNQGHAKLDATEVVVLDEADRMLDMGFIRDVRKIAAALPASRQTLLFSATMPREVADLAASLLTDPARVEVAPQSTTAERVDQRVMFVDKSDKRALLVEFLAKREVERALVFARTKHGADRIVKHLTGWNIQAAAIHGDKTQGARQKALEDFRKGKARVLVATDIAARGIDVDGVTHVVNFDLPNEPETYVHRIGRTARAGATGIAVSFCDADERAYLRDIEKTIRRNVAVEANHSYHAANIADLHAAAAPAKPPKRGGGGRPGGHGGPQKVASQNARRGGAPKGAPAHGARQDAGRRPAGNGGAARPRRKPASQG